MKTLIVYYSLTRNNELLAIEIQRQLGCDILRIEEAKRRNTFAIFFDAVFNRRPPISYATVTLENYQRFIFVAPIWAGKVASPLKTFLHGHREKLRPYSFITLCGGGADQHNKIVQDLTTVLEHAPDKVMELRLTDLLKQSKAQEELLKYRVTPDDIAAFQPWIDAFIHDSAVLV